MQLGCEQRHRFDANKRGFVNLLTGKRAKALGDSGAMLRAREQFLRAGHYSPIARAVAGNVPTDAARILDAGCGTGYYLQQVAEGRPSAHCLGLDASTDAVTTTVRTAGCPGVVANTWHDLPVRSAIADTILCVFAPRNRDEFARILRPGGILVTVTPRPAHLAELSSSGAVIGMQNDKATRLDSSLRGRFRLRERTEVTFSSVLTATELDAIIYMGPTGHHEPRKPASSGTTLTISVDVSAFELL